MLHPFYFETGPHRSVIVIGVTNILILSVRKVSSLHTCSRYTQELHSFLQVVMTTIFDGE